MSYYTSLNIVNNIFASKQNCQFYISTLNQTHRFNILVFNQTILNPTLRFKSSHPSNCEKCSPKKNGFLFIPLQPSENNTM